MPIGGPNSTPIDIMAEQQQAAPPLELAERAERLGIDVWADAPAISPPSKRHRLADFRATLAELRITMAADKTQPLELARLPPRRAELKPGDLGRLDPIHDQPEGAGRPTSGVPLQLDQHEGIAGKQRRPILDDPTEACPPIPQPRVVGFISVQAQAMQRQRLTMRLEAADAPIGHSCYLRAH